MSTKTTEQLLEELNAAGAVITVCFEDNTRIQSWPWVAQILSDSMSDYVFWVEVGAQSQHDAHAIRFYSAVNDGLHITFLDRAGKPVAYMASADDTPEVDAAEVRAARAFQTSQLSDPETAALYAVFVDEQRRLIPG